MDALLALQQLRRGAPLPPGLAWDAEDEAVVLRARRDMLHLDADALHDRLHHWTMAHLERVLPAARAYVSFDRARPAAPDEEATLDQQEVWHDLDPTLALDLARATPEDLRALSGLVPAFLALVEGVGRPAGFRPRDVGNVE